MALPKLFEVPGDLGQVVESGIFKSVHELNAPLWIDGHGVEFRDGQVRKARGYYLPTADAVLFDSGAGLFDAAAGFFDSGTGAADFTSPSAVPIRGVQQQRQSDRSQHLFWGDSTNLYHSSGSAGASVGSGFTMQVDELSEKSAHTWSMVSWGDWMIATNGIDVPQIYKGASFTALGGVPFSAAEIFKVLGPFLLAFNTNNTGAFAFEWSKQDDPEVWDPTANATAGNLPIREFASEIVAAAHLGQALMVYGDDQSAIITHRGAPFIFGYRMGPGSIGAISKNSVVSVGRQNFGWGKNGIWVTDGTTVQYIDTPAIRQYIRDNLNRGQKSKIWGYHDEEQQRVVWYFPKGTSSNLENNTGIGYSYVNGSWTFYGHGKTCAIERQVYGGPLAGTSNGQIVELEIDVIVGTQLEVNPKAMNSWTATRVSVSADNTTAPDGTTTADKIVVDSSSSTTHVLQSATITKAAADTSYAWAGYFKQAGYSDVQIKMQGTDANNNITVVADLELGVISSTAQGSGADPFDVRLVDVYALDDDWFCVMIQFVSNSATNLVTKIELHNGTSTSFTGDGASGIYAWNIQMYAQSGFVTPSTLISKPFSNIAGEARPDITKYLDELFIIATDVAGTDLTWRVGIQDELSDAVTYTTAAAIQEGYAAETLDLTSPWFRIRLDSYSMNDELTAGGFTITGEDEADTQ